MAENKTLYTRIVLRNDSSTGWLSNDTQVLLKGEVGIEFLNTGKVKIKIGDGVKQWKELPYFGSENLVITTDTLEPGADHMAAIAAKHTEEIPVGAIAIVKEKVTAEGNTFTTTGYTYNGTAWVAMNGNVKAENVYFDDNMMVTKEIGYITIANGQGTIPSKGKNLPEVFEAMFVKESNPSKTDPAVTVTLGKAGSYEVGTKLTGITYSASFSDGSYSYGPEPTGAEVTKWVVTSTKGYSNTIEPAEGATTVASSISSTSLADVTVDEGTTLSVTAKATHTAGETPLTNKGNPCTDSSKKIAAGTKTKTSSVISGYRSSFYYVGTDHTSTLNSAFVRGGTNRNSNTKNFNVDTVDGVDCLIIPQGTTRIVLAVPGAATLKEVKDIVGMGLDVKANFTPKTVAVEGVDGYTAKDYTVFECINANGLDATRYAITFN